MPLAVSRGPAGGASLSDSPAEFKFKFPAVAAVRSGCVRRPGQPRPGSGLRLGLSLAVAVDGSSNSRALAREHALSLRTIVVTVTVHRDRHAVAPAVP
eukprot:3931620-Rhodomonas_salina.1